MAGTYSDDGKNGAGSEACQPCGPGTYSGLSGATTCKPRCDAGFNSTTTGESTFNSTTCKPCDVGTYSNSTGTVNCTSCFDGWTTLVPGSTFCFPMKDCLAGTYRKTVDGTCIPCSPGSFSTVNNSASCTLCETGKHSAVQGALSCQARCGPGFYSKTSGESTFFSETCQTCPRDFDAPTGSTTLTNCTCAAGFFGPNVGPCVPCPAGSFKAGAGSAGCTQCVHGKRSTTRSVDKDDCVTMQTPMVSEVCPKAPIQNWDDPRFSRCKLLWSWDELYDGYRNHSITWYHGLLHRRQVTGKFEHYVCVKGDPCSTDLTDAFFCYVWSIRDGVFLPWGPNSVLKLLHLPVTEDEVLHLRAENKRIASDLQDITTENKKITVLLANLTATVAALVAK